MKSKKGNGRQNIPHLKYTYNVQLHAWNKLYHNYHHYYLYKYNFLSHYCD